LITTEKHFNDHALESTDSHAVAKPSHAKRSVAWAQTMAFVLGAALLVYVVRKIGVQPIFTALSHVGFGFFLVVALNGLRHMLRTIAMRLSVTPEHRRFTFLQAFAARLGGESMSFAGADDDRPVAIRSIAKDGTILGSVSSSPRAVEVPDAALAPEA